jgi:hypothetical protein
MIDAHISSTDRIAAFFGIAPGAKAGKRGMAEASVPPAEPKRARSPRRPRSGPAVGIHAAIDDALRAAGLLR